MSRDDLKFYVGMALALLAILVLACVGAYYDGCQKAAAFERVTGKHVDVWDAMWLDLKVQEPVR